MGFKESLGLLFLLILASSVALAILWRRFMSRLGLVRSDAIVLRVSAELLVASAALPVRKANAASTITAPPLAPFHFPRAPHSGVSSGVRTGD